MKLKVFMTVLAALCLAITACNTNPGLIDRSVPVSEQVLVTIVNPNREWLYSTFIYGEHNLSLFVKTTYSKQILLPAGTQTIRARWPVTIDQNETQYHDRIQTRTTYRMVDGTLTYDFKPGLDYTIYVVGETLTAEENPESTPQSIRAVWVGSPVSYWGWMYPNSAAYTFGLNEGFEFFVGKMDLKLAAEAAVGFGFSTGPALSDIISREDVVVPLSAPFTVGLKAEYFITPKLGLTLGGGLAGDLFGSMAEGDIKDDEGNIIYSGRAVPIVPYIQAQLNFRGGRSNFYPSYPFEPISIYANYYHVTDPNKASFFGVGIAWLDL